MSIWVCPHCPKKSAEREIEKIEGLARLYAYPCEPRFENGGLVILDSGAFGLSQSGGKMNFAYMQKLSQHYEKYYRDGMLCVAPDEFLNPIQSMMNFQKWHKSGLFANITPVLQCEKKFVVNAKSILQQAEFYSVYSDTILFSNPGLTAEMSREQNIEQVFKRVKEIGYKWIHNLGAGWNIEDIRAWANIRYLDSFDSVSYYTTKDVHEFGSLNALENVKKVIECLKT